jgi:serine phosphatase RsbU (regulator of sigma subunit)/lipopolysaccharide biosynthesis regulator YciM
MKRCGSFLFFVSLLLPFLVLAQSSRIDSLKAKNKSANDSELLNKISDAYIGLNPDSAEAYAYKALELARKQKNKKQEVEALKNLGMAISRKGEDDEAIKIFQEGVAISKTSGERSVEGDIYRLWGNALYHQALYDSALTKYLTALTIFRELDNKIKMAGVLNNIGNVYYFISRSASESYYLQALEIYKKLNDTSGLAKQYGNLGLVYINKQDTEKAIEYSQKSLEYNLIRKDKIGIATSYINLGYAYEQAGKFELALENVKRSLELREQSGDKKGIAVSTTMLGKIYCTMRDYKNGIIYLEKGRELSKEIDLNIAALEELEILARAYYATGRLDDAQEMDEEIRLLKEEEDEKKLQERVAELETEYKTKEKDAQIQIQELSLKRRSLYLWGAAGFIILLWVILGVSYNAYRNKQKTNALLEKKNKEITRQKEEITDSIHYAQTIQRAILPPEKLLQKYLPDSFVIFKPKDIVSGDFYWTEKVKDRVYFAAVDCTGHGVPGAFMSIIGHNGLNRAVKDFKLTHPAEILDKLVELVTEALHAENQGEIKDGMDVALCCLDTEQRKLEYAGAYNPVYLIRDKEVLEFKADRQPIGAFEKRLPFTNHEIQLQKDDCIYVFSDGVVDQFGGEKGKKLSSKRMKEMLLSVVHLPMAQQYTELHNRFTAWQGKEEQTDDVTLIGVRV